MRINGIRLMNIFSPQGIRTKVLRAAILSNVFGVALSTYKNPALSFKALKKLLFKFETIHGSVKMIKYHNHDGKYYWDMFSPPWPSLALNRVVKQHLLEVQPMVASHFPLRMLLVAITKRCPLQCEHCSEAATLYGKDLLTRDELADKIERYVDLGAGQLILSGGEPLSRWDDLLLLTERFKRRSSIWIYTSGYGLTLEKAMKLKESGLKGVAVSLDHHSEGKHNAFRGNRNSFRWVKESIANCQAAGLVTALNVCPIKSFIEEKGPEELLQTAKDLNVSFVNFLEPRAVGNYEDKDVELEEQHKEYLSLLSNKYNSLKFSDYPTICYPAAVKKTHSCGGGHSFIFMDYDGSIYPCPFCKTKISTTSSSMELCES